MFSHLLFRERCFSLHWWRKENPRGRSLLMSAKWMRALTSTCSRVENSKLPVLELMHSHCIVSRMPMGSQLKFQSWKTIKRNIGFFKAPATYLDRGSLTWKKEISFILKQLLENIWKSILLDTLSKLMIENIKYYALEYAFYFLEHFDLTQDWIHLVH